MDTFIQKTLEFNHSIFDISSYINTCLNQNQIINPYYANAFGTLFKGDCLEVFPMIQNSSIDTIFADPPFNLNKKYGKNSRDNLAESEYLEWCYQWIDECIRILKPGGALFIYNLPKWNIS